MQSVQQKPPPFNPLPMDESPAVAMAKEIHASPDSEWNQCYYNEKSKVKCFRQACPLSGSAALRLRFEVNAPVSKAWEVITDRSVTHKWDTTNFDYEIIEQTNTNCSLRLDRTQFPGYFKLRESLVQEYKDESSRFLLSYSVEDERKPPHEGSIRMNQRLWIVKVEALDERAQVTLHVQADLGGAFGWFGGALISLQERGFPDLAGAIAKEAEGL